jgi:hypothetical protein
VDGVGGGLSPRDTAPTPGSSNAVGVGVLGVECVYPLAVGVAFVEIFAGGIAKIGGKKLWWSLRKEGTGRGVTWSLFRVLVSCVAWHSKKLRFSFKLSRM